ncbi:RNA polymerase sigma factor [Marinoscillum sp.]|uniref:RNA polymerase sigma factor n=1 Tax=Marinoscillum sp. TaxID=2024838 RepID=UPI003BA9534D
MFFRKTKHSEEDIIKECLKRKPSGQKALYELYFNYSMSIAMRYASGKDEAIEIVNDSFLKVFDSLDRYDPKQPLKAWLRQIVIYTAIDAFRKNQRYQHSTLESHMHLEVSEEESVFSQLHEAAIMECVQKLPPSYRTVFVLYVVEGYKHHEIATLLKISEGTSKSNLSAARAQLKKMLVTDTQTVKRHG